MGIVISIPRGKMGTKASVISTLITAIIVTIIGVVFLVMAISPKELTVTQSFSVSSTYVGGGGDSDYQCTITGEVKNTTDKTLYNVVFEVEVDGYNSDYIWSGDITIAEIKPGETKRVQEVCYVGDDCDSIYSISYSINGGDSKTLFGESGEDWIIMVVIGIMAIVMWIVFIVSVAKYKKKKNSTQEVFGGNTFGGTVSTAGGQVVSNPFTEAPAPTQAQTPTAVSAQTCPYCGSKIQASDGGKCPGCGAKL